MDNVALTRLLPEWCTQAMRQARTRHSIASPTNSEHNPTLAQAYTFLPGLVEHHLTQEELPSKRELAVLFVDMADSARAILRQPPQVALATVQHFMSVVTNIALDHCGDVKDYEGDGALLYFASIEKATRAALAMRETLAQEAAPGGTTLQARFSLNVGEVVIGVIGSPLRQSVALIGPAVSLASRLLKHIPPNGIIAPQAAVEKLSEQDPDLATQFQLWQRHLTLKGFEEEAVTAYHLPSNLSGVGKETLSCQQTFSLLSPSCNSAVSVSEMIQ